MRTDGHTDVTELIVAFRNFFGRALKIVQERLQVRHFFFCGVRKHVRR